MTYVVLVEELRGAAGAYRGVADELGAGALCLTYRDPDNMGHVELAAWLGAVAEQCVEASQALHDGAVGLAEDLQTAGHHYETTDDGVAEMFRPTFPFPFGPPGAPPLLGPSGPVQGPLGPLHGPPSPVVGLPASGPGPTP